MVKGLGKGNFVTEKQRKKVMKDLNPNCGRSKIDKLPEDFSINYQQVLDTIAWSGCLIHPQFCPIITCINEAYKNYKNFDEHNFKEILKDLTSIIIESNQNIINDYSNKMVFLLEHKGFLDNISEEANVDKDTLKNIIKGTFSNLFSKEIEIAAGFIIDRTV